MTGVKYETRHLTLHKAAAGAV